MKARLAKIAGYRRHLQKTWGRGGCPKDVSSCHRAELLVSEGPTMDAVEGRFPGDDDPIWSSPQLVVCQHCGTPAPADASHSGSSGPIYDTPSGKLEPGCVVIADWYGCAQRGGKCIHGWTNCDGKHLHAVLPNGATWDIDGRASNCTMPADTTHRCWVRHGEPPAVHVDKAGHTCAAGAGSIAVPGYHGFLHNGEFTGC